MEASYPPVPIDPHCLVALIYLSAADVLTQIARHETDAAPPGLPSASNSSGNVRGNKRSKVYHLSVCPGYEAMSPANIVTFASEAEAQQSGYRKAKHCR